MSFFIDRLCIYQDHNRLLPMLGDNGFARIDLETGDIDLDNINVKRKKIEGSFSSSVMVRCNGHVVNVEGNPSRWQRIDNLFGLDTFDECIAVYNQILHRLGLPPFTKNTEVNLMPSRTGTHLRKGNGAVITHIDFTKNHVVGNGNEQSFIAGLSTMSINRSVAPYLYPNRNTVEWFSKSIQGKGSSFRYSKVYAKAADMIKRRKERISKADYEMVQYYDRLTAWVIERGIAREEHSFKSKFLNQYNLNLWGLVNESDFAPYLECITDITKRLEVSHMNYETIAEQLIDQGVVKTKQAANCTMSYYMLWAHGHEIDKTKRQYFEHRKRLKQIGIDIGVKLDISRSPIRLKDAQVIEVKPLTLSDMPDWYIKPQSNAADNVVQLFRAA